MSDTKTCPYCSRPIPTRAAVCDEHVARLRRDHKKALRLQAHPEPGDFELYDKKRRKERRQRKQAAIAKTGEGMRDGKVSDFLV